MTLHITSKFFNRKFKFVVFCLFAVNQLYAQDDCVFDGKYLTSKILTQSKNISKFVEIKKDESFSFVYKKALKVSLQNRICYSYGVKIAFAIDTINKLQIRNYINDILFEFLQPEDYLIFKQNISNKIELFVNSNPKVKNKTIELPSGAYDTYHIYLKRNINKIEIEIEFYLS